VKQASVRFEEVTQFYSKVAAKLATLDVEGLPGGLGLLSSFQTKLADFTKLIQLPPQDRRLLRGGIVETPSAGYLPVVPGESATVNAQVRQWMGEGVDLRFCVVRPDFVPHALEEAQHMERISLTQGLDNPQAKPQVDVLVPNGVILKQPTASPGQGYEAVVQLFPKHNDDQPQLMAMRIAPAASINLQGAATTHSLPAGGAAFYLAGASVAPKTSVIKGLMETLTEVGSSHLSNLSDLRNAANIQPAPTGNIGSNAALFSRLNLNAATAARIAAALRAGETTVAPPPVAQQVAAIWIQLSCSHNPFMLSLGATAAASLRVTTVLPGNTGNPTPGTTDYRLFGDLVITQAASGGGTKTVRGAFSGTYVIDNQTAPVGGPLRFEIEATYDVNADTVHVKLTGLNSSKLTIQFEVKTAWQGDPQKVLSHVVYRVLRGDTMSQEVSLLGSSLTRNDEVLQAGQASHTAALSALDVIAAALKDSAFADMAAGLLFPPPPPPSSDLVVRATLDWVLFHRRRTKTCATETVNVVASARRYQVFHLRAPNADEAAEVIKALLNNDSAALQRFGFKPVDVVEFAAGGPALNTPASAIQADWSVASPPPSQVHYAAIASQGAATADGNSLALQRLGRFQDAILPLSPPEPQARYETLPLFPTALPAPGLDGDIVVITIAAPIFTTHRVLRTFLALTDLLKIIQKNGISKTVADQHAQDLGLVQFREHTSDPKTDDLDGIKSKWISSGPGTVIDVGVVFDPADTSDTSATRVGQSKAICKEIGVTLTPHTFPITVTVEPVVNSVTILQVQPVVIEVIANRRARLLIWRPDVTGAGRILLPLPGPITLEFKPDGALVKRLTAAEVKALKTFGSTVRLTEFFTREAIPDAQVEDRAKALAKELDSQGFKPTITPKIAPLPPAISGLVPADAASSQDIVFLEVLG
jgi:hypothetical protein